MRYIYAMRKVKRCFYARCTCQEEIKIGIAQDVKERNKVVDAAIQDSKVEILWAYKIPFARTIEKELHRTFSTSRFTLRRAGKGAGKTEWFYLNWLEIVLLMFFVWWYRFRWYIYFLTPLILFLYLYFKATP